MLPKLSSEYLATPDAPHLDRLPTETLEQRVARNVTFHQQGMDIREEKLDWLGQGECDLLQLLSLSENPLDNIGRADNGLVDGTRTAVDEVYASSVLKKRRRRMNHHKHKKWLKKMKYRLKSEGRL